MRKRRPFTLMPAIALAALGAMVTVPALSSVRLEAAGPQRYAVVRVHPGDTLWGLAAAHSQPSQNVQEAVDRIIEANHLRSASVRPGQRLRIPL